MESRLGGTQEESRLEAERPDGVQMVWVEDGWRSHLEAERGSELGHLPLGGQLRRRHSEVDLSNGS